MQLFFNSQPTLETVRLLDLSNGLPTQPHNITLFGNSLHAESFASMDGCFAQDSCPATIFVAHLDVPDGVTVSSRAEVNDLPEDTCPSAPAGSRTLAGLPLPVKRELTPPRVLQYHLGVDTGTDACAGPSCGSASSRITIGIYNAGAVTATAIVETRRGCDDKTMERRIVMVPSNSVVHAGGFPSDTSGCAAFEGKAPNYSMYAVVSMDQPGFSYAISLRNDAPPYLSGTAPVSP
jgi:hypothetical protein